MNVKRMGMLECVFPIGFLMLALGLGGNVGAEERLPAAKQEIEPPTAEWKALIEKIAPEHPTVKAVKRKLLVFSLFTGYDHKVSPHVDEVLQILGKKSGAFDAALTVDIEMLTPEKLGAFDVLVLNNNCSYGERRHLFLDELERNEKYRDLNEQERQAKADALEQSLLAYVSGGKGLVAIHGAPTMLNNSEKYTEMIGGAFDYHPANQDVTLRTVDKNHPLVAAFRGKEPLIHRDEPYLFKGAYDKLDFRPLLSMDTDSLNDARGGAGKIARYVAWIKPYGSGRVFYCSPSHFPESYESPTILRFLLDGIQYAAGDLKCDDSKP